MSVPGQVWPQATVHEGVLHLVRSSLRYVSRKHWGSITKALRTIYTAPTIDAAEDRFSEFEETWGCLYPAIIRLWRTPGSSSPRS